MVPIGASEANTSARANQAFRVTTAVSAAILAHGGLCVIFPAMLNDACCIMVMEEHDAPDGMDSVSLTTKSCSVAIQSPQTSGQSLHFLHNSL